MPAAYRSYLIFYRPIRNGVEVLTVLHGARDLQAIIERLTGERLTRVDGSGLLGECFGPFLFFGSFGLMFGGDRTLPWPLPKREGDGTLAAGLLEIGAEPADRAAAFFFGPLVVEGNEAGE